MEEINPTVTTGLTPLVKEEIAQLLQWLNSENLEGFISYQIVGYRMVFNINTNWRLTYSDEMFISFDYLHLFDVNLLTAQVENPEFTSLMLNAGESLQEYVNMMNIYKLGDKSFETVLEVLPLLVKTLRKHFQQFNHAMTKEDLTIWVIMTRLSQSNFLSYQHKTKFVEAITQSQDLNTLISMFRSNLVKENNNQSLPLNFAEEIVNLPQEWIETMLPLA